MLVSDVMTREPTSCRPTDSLRRAAELMSVHGCGFLPIVDEHGRLKAIVSDRDLCMAACRDDLPPERTQVEQIAQHEVLTVRKDDPVEKAESLMRRYRMRRLPVVDGAGRPIGVVSLHDLARLAHWAGSRGDRLTPESVVTTELAVGGHSRCT